MGVRASHAATVHGMTEGRALDTVRCVRSLSSALERCRPPLLERYSPPSRTWKGSWSIDLPWASDAEVTEFPRYQVHLLLSEENAIP